MPSAIALANPTVFDIKTGCELCIAYAESIEKSRLKVPIRHYGYSFEDPPAFHGTESTESICLPCILALKYRGFQQHQTRSVIPIDYFERNTRH